MTTVTRTTTVDSSPDRIWVILAALDRYDEWESGYVSAEFTSEQREGPGTTRRVELKSPVGVRFADHEVTRWEPSKAIAWKASDSNFPMLATAEQTVTLTPADSGTEVTNSVIYGLKYGLLGRIVDPLMFKRVVVGANEGFLSSLEMAVGSH